MQTKREYAPIQLSPKRQVIDAAGYRFNWRHALYVNQNLKKAFSAEFVRDHTAEEIEACVQECTPGTAWRFYFNQSPGPSVRQQLETALG